MNRSLRGRSIRILPGQYFDKETNTSYNYFRDYDPATGRYVQSDPMGLVGGINPVAYVGSSPLLAVDPLGLFKVEAPPPQNLSEYQLRQWKRMVWTLNFYGERFQKEVIDRACAEDQLVLQRHFDNWVVDIDPSFFDLLHRRDDPVTSFERQRTTFTWGFFAEKPYYQSEDNPGRWFVFAHEFRHLLPANQEIYQKTIRGDLGANSRWRLGFGVKPPYELDADLFARATTRSCSCGVTR